jgi:hypothetical protein
VPGDASASRTDVWPPSEALLDVKGGLGWSAARVPVELDLAEGQLTITIGGDEPTGKERKALKRLFGAEAGVAGEQQLALVVDLDDAEIGFPGAPGRRSWIVIALPDRPTFRLYFLDWGELEERPTSVIRMGRYAASSRSAAEARQAWRAAIEAEAN